MTPRVGLGRLLPPSVELEESEIDAPETVLLDAERAAIASAVPKRRAEFATVRDCARRALARLGQPPVPIVPGPDREPQWPDGIVGSLTHCDGYRAAAVAFSSDIVTLGIDAEVNEPLPDGVAPLVMVGDEPRTVDALAANYYDACWDRLLFSAKESIYKAWWPLARRWLDFTECELTIDPTGSFSGNILIEGPVHNGSRLQRFDGRWDLVERHLITVTCLERSKDER